MQLFVFAFKSGRSLRLIFEGKLTVVMSSISGLLSSINALKDITQTIIAVRDSQVLQPQLFEIQSKLLEANSFALSAQQDHLTLLEKVSSLEKKVADLKAWDAEKQKYERRVVSKHSGVIAYALKEESEQPKPSHWLCATCFQNGKPSTLQPEMRYPGGAEVLICHQCGSDLYVSGGWQPEHKGRTRK